MNNGAESSRGPNDSAGLRRERANDRTRDNHGVGTGAQTNRPFLPGRMLVGQ